MAPHEERVARLERTVSELEEKLDRALERIEALERENFSRNAGMPGYD